MPGTGPGTAAGAAAVATVAAGPGRSSGGGCSVTGRSLARRMLQTPG